MMTLKELLDEKVKKEKELQEIYEQIRKCQNLSAVSCYETLIKTFEELGNLLPDETLELETYCEECETERDILIEFEVIVRALEYEKNKLERKINNE